MFCDFVRRRNTPAKSAIGMPLAFLGLSAIGCSPTLVVQPDVAKVEKSDFVIEGRLRYEGNREYLPRTIAETASGESALDIEYSYDVSYGARNSAREIAALFNPLTILGFPIDEDSVLVVGELKIIGKNENTRTYSAKSGVRSARGLFAGGTLSELRRSGLIAVRNNLEAQLARDREALMLLAKNH